MRIGSISRFGWKGAACATLVLVSLLLLPYWSGITLAIGANLSSTEKVAQVWKNVRNSQQYDFSADVTVKTIPLPTASNIGRFSKTDSLYLEGSNNLRKQNLQMAMWGGGISVADRSAAYQVRVLDGAVQTRVGDEEWQSSDDNAVAFAPGGDFLSFLDLAQNVTLADEASIDEASATKSDDRCTGADCSHLTAYTFDLDSRAYAQKMVNLYQEQLARSGKLPIGATLQLPDPLVQTTGSGKLWVDDRGLPVRQKVNLSIPPAAGADNRSEAVLDIHFTNYQSDPPLLAAIPGVQSLVNALASVQFPSPSTLALNMGLFSLAVLGMAALIRPGRRTRFGITVTMLIATVVTPTLQAQAATISLDRLQVAQTQQKEIAKGTEIEKTAQDIQAAMRAAGPYRPPEAVLNLVDAAPVLQSATLDSDGDGLTDQVENLIGSSPYRKDSDFDTISDRDEVVGFSYNGKMWYGNPLWADSNNDGVIDGMEWNKTTPDSDGDGTPDLYDFDDDGDGVPDNIDISRLVASKDNSGNLIAFSQSNPLTLTIDGLQANRYTYVNLQLRPTNPDQLWYAFNVLNWPHDEKGNMQDWDNKTFFDYCKKIGGSNCNMSPDDNGDIKIVPMLEVTLPDQSSLPRTANGSIDTDLLNKYGINVRPAGNGGYLLYAPLTLVEDSVTGNKVAFSTQLIYQNAATWKPEQLRLSWLVQVLNETYNSPEAANKALKDGNGMGQNQATVLYAYYTDFYLTGLNVREDHGVDMAIVYEDPATDNNVNEDEALMQMIVGLDASYMVNRDCDITDNAGKCIGNGQRDITIPTIKQRWDSQSNSGTTAGQRWGIAANRLRVETYSFAHEDAATMTAGGQYAPAILNTHFRNTAATKPSLLFVRESRFRASNIDIRAATNTNSVIWNGRDLKIGLGDVAEMITGNYTLSPYQFNSSTSQWTRQTPQEYVAELEHRYPVSQENAPITSQTISTGDQTAVIITGISATQGSQSVLSQNGSSGLTAALGNQVFKGADITDESLRRDYAEAIASSAKSAVLIVSKSLRNAMQVSREAWDAMAKVLGNASSSTDVHSGALSDFTFKNVDLTQSAKVQALYGVISLAFVGLGILVTNLKGGEAAGQVILAGITAINSTVQAVMMYRNISSILSTVSNEAVKGLELFTTTLSFSHALNSGLAKASAVGAVIGIGVTWVLFFAAWGKGGLSTDSVEFNSLLAGTIGSTLTAVVFFLLSLSVVGTILIAVFAIFDLIALIICKAGVKLACSLGITEAMTKLITEWIYTGGVMIDTKADPAITNIDDAQIRLTQPEQGLVAGNSARFEIDLFTYVRHAVPEPGIIYHYGSFFTPEDLRSTTVKYALDNSERKLSADLNQTNWAGIIGYSWVEADVPSPVVGWLVPTRKTKNLYQGARNDILTSGVYQFNTAKINQQFPLYLNTGLALPRYDCWFQVCVHKATKSSTSTDLGKSFILDILPATLDQFMTWSELGPQVDPDGDGLGKLVDPDQTKWDADNDGVPDGVEYEYGIKRGYGFNPRVADADSDGLNDALEIRYQTNPRKADTDGDGISDFDEVNGYMITLGGQSFFVNSNPNLRDTDKDGMSDGVERRLNGIDPLRYPFNPRHFNDAPARLYTTINDADRVFAVNQRATVTTTVLNGTAPADSLLAAGVFTASLPAQLGGATQTRNFTLLPSAQSDIVLNGQAAAANGDFTINSSLAADIVSVGTTPSGPADDIILDGPVVVTIDSDLPSLPTLSQGAFVQPGRTVVIGGTASDPTSYISKVEVSVGGGGYGAAMGTDLWAFSVDIPNAGPPVPINVRAFDAVNNNSSANFNLTLDSNSPNLTVNLHAGDRRRVQRNAAGAWTMKVDGTVNDVTAGVQSVTAQIGSSSNYVITPTAIVNGAWSVTYAFDELSFNADPSPTGDYTLTVTARDNALPDGNPTVQEIPFVIDMTPPTVTMLSHRDDDPISDSTIFTGTVYDTYSSVAGVEVALVDASTVFSTEETLLQLPLNDLPSTVLFRNNANDPTRIFCLDESCPTSGVAGADGTAASFDGNDLLRSFETLDLPESGLTTAFWFKTTCANCGLFSAIAGQFPTQTGHDRDLFLDHGNVCSAVQAGASLELRCSGGTNYADDNWHQVVHTLGTLGNRLYVDGVLAVSSPTTASTFTTQNRVLLGYATAATTPFLSGALDDFFIYTSELAADSVATLYRRWQPATLNGNTWSFAVPSGLEGYYQIDMRAVDSLGNRGESRGDWPQLHTTIDTKLPTFDLKVAYAGSGSSATTIYSATVRDDNLSADNYQFACPLTTDQLRYATDPALLRFAGSGVPDLAEIVAQCTRPGFQSSLVSANACDEFGHCAAAIPSQSVAYIGTYQNTLSPFGRLPNAIERVNLSDPRNRVRLIERPGQLILDIAVDEAHGKLYWAEKEDGSGQTAGIWRANLDGSSPTQIVSGLNAYAAEALQIAIDPAGNKLYWTQGYQLWWANLDGTLKQVVYSIPPDIRFIGGAVEVMQIGDVVVDGANGHLYLSERRQRGDQAGYTSGIRNFGQIFRHTLIVTTNLNGASPDFIAGAGAGCTYANFYDNLGSGVGAGQKPTLCLTSGSDGFDVEAMAVRNGTLYWSAIDADGVNAGVYGRSPISSTFKVASLGLNGNSRGLRTAPLPQVYVDSAAVGVFVGLGTQIVRGERDGSFTQFSTFVDNTPAAAGSSRRNSSSLSAFTVIETAQVVQQDADLAVGITAPSTVVVNGDTVRYDMTVRNDAALPAMSTTLTMTLPQGASFASASRSCVDGGSTVRCDFGNFGGLSQQSLSISLTIATSNVHVLTTTVSVASSTVERNPANNSAVHSNITAAPNLSAFSGLPYIYYGNVTELTRVPLFGDYTSEPLFLSPSLAGSVLAADHTRNKLFLIDPLDKLIMMNPDGSGRVELANANATGLSSSGRLHIAADESTGRVYWSEIATIYLTTIKSAKPDGSDIQTVVSNVMDQRGLLVDPIRGKLFWVAGDTWQRQEFIYRSNLDGSNREIIYAAPAGSQIRYLALDPYNQKLYWIDPITDDGTLFWSDADGGRVAALPPYISNDARGLVVQPAENAIYYVSYTDLMRANLDGSNETVIADLSQRAYDGLRLPLDPTVFTPIFLTRPSGNLVLLSGTPFASPPCSVNDTHEPNNSAATATAIGVGNTTGALCKIRSSLPVDMDFYTVTVPSGKQLNLTLSNLPANYDLYLQRSGVTLATSQNSGLTNDSIAQPNYDSDGTYVIAVFSNTPINNVNPYTLNVSLSDAPARTVFTNAECLAVDPNDAAGGAGNYQQSQATPLTVGTPITGALCYQNDVDFYRFNAVAGQAFTFDLPMRPAAYELHLYRPNGSFFNAWNPSGFNQPIILDASGQWAVAVLMPNLTPTLATYQLLVTDGTCSLNDAWEPNNTATQAASLSSNRVSATLCNASDADFYDFSATAGQRLTLNYPVNNAGGALRLLDANGVEQGRVLPGNQGNFVLGGGNYTLATSNGSLATNDAAYTFQWLLDAPQPAAGTDYIYLGNLPHLVRVALTNDHTVEALSIAGASPGLVRAADFPMVTNAARDQLYLVDSIDYGVISATTSGLTSTVLITDANPDNINALNNGIAIDEVSGYLFWTQPYGAINGNTSTLMRANLDGSGSPVQIKQIYLQNGLLVDSVYGHLYWAIGEAIFRSNLDGSGQVTVRDFTPGNDQVNYLSLDPLARQLYWIDPVQNQLVRRSLLNGSETVLVSGLSSPHGIVLRPERNELYYTSGDALLRANLDGSNPVQIATLSGQYNGPWNLDPNSNFLAPIAQPASNLVLAKGAPLLNPCTLADGNEPNNDAGTATALSVVTQTVAYGAICGSYGDVDYYKISVADRKTLSVTLSQLPANYRVIVQSPPGVNQAFSDNDGLADEAVSVSNTSGATVEYTILVLGLGPVNNNRYKLTLELGDVPPPPNPSDLQCGAVDSYDTPGVGNGTLATATSIGFGTSLAAALCYSDDVDMYAFAGLAGQSVKIDLPVRPQDYTLTLYDPSGAPTTVISSTTSPAYGDSIVLNASGRYTVAVSFPNLTPTTDQYQLFVTDENCVASDANEPNNSVPLAKVVNNGSRVRATLCSASDVDLYRLSATAGQQLTINYPANATGASLRVVPAAGGADLGVVSAGNQGLFTIPTNGDYLLRLENNGLSGSALPYLFEVLLGSPTTPTSGTPYLYYSRVSDLIRTSIVSGTVEPILLPNTFVAGSVIAADSVRSKLYILDYSERIVQANPDGTAAQVVVANTGPDVLRFTESLAVDERSGRIYWTQATFGVVSDIRSANGDGSDVQTLVTGVVDDHGLAIDPVAGRIYWAQTTLYNGAIVDHIRRSNLDGSDVQTLYAAPEGRQIRELTVDPYAQTLYWRDPTQNELLQIPADGGDVTTIATVTDARGFVVRPLLDELYYVADSQLWRADRNGNNPVAIARLDGEYNGVSNLDSNVFYPTVLTPPGSNLALANSVPFEQPCGTVDLYEPNDTLATATAITTGTLTAALCTADLNQNDLYDYYKLTVADDRQISVTLTNLPQDYGLVLIADGVGVGWSYNSGTADEFLTHINRSGAAVVYTILVLRNGANSSRLPYTLIVEEGAAPPPPPPPAPPADACAPYDLYDQPGYLGNQTRDSATPISFNTPITAALCYQADADYYSFDGVVGQNVTIDLPTRPADYYISIYDPNGNYVNGIFPGSWLNYGDKLTLNSAGRWTLVVWYPNLQPTTSQYQLLLSVNTTCSGLDPYEPNNDQGSPSQILTRTMTLRTMLCETNDWDWYSFPVNVGDRIQINLRSLSPGMRLNAAGPQGGFFEFNENIDAIMSSSGDFMLAIAPPQNNTTENLPYIIDVQIDAPPAPTPLPNNWSCSVYPSSDIPKHIDDLTTFGSTVNVPVSGTVTHVGLRDITFDHGGLYNLSFGLGAPDGPVKELFAFDDYGFYVWCGGSNCQLSLDDAAQAGLRPPQFPNNGGTFRPSRNSFAPFNGKASNGTWTFYVTDNGESGGGDVGDTTGDLFSWGLEVCVDNGNPPDPTSTPVPTSTPEPQPTDGAPTGGTNGDTVIATPTLESCILTADPFEEDDTALNATAFDMAIGSSAGHNFDRVDDADWQVITLTVGLQYTFIANTVDSAQSVSLALYQSDGTTLIQATNGQLIYEPTSSGRYYLRTTSNSGLSANLCRSDYSIVIESDNPNATPVPLPTGTPQPPNHDAPPISAAILAPTDGSALTTTQPITILVGLNTENEIQDAALFVNGSWQDSYLPGSGEQDVTWQSDWTPSQAGVYSLTALITDTLNLTATSSANVVYVDLTGPSVSIISETVTLAKLASDGSYPLQGTATDDSQVAQVEVRLDGGDWQQALLNGSNWFLAISPAALADPDGGNLAIEARATDKAGRTANTTANIIVDVTPPEVFTATTSLLSGALISPSQVVTELNARLSWPAISGAVSIYAGWSVTPTATVDTLTAYGAAVGTHDQAMPEGSALYAHVVAVDALGNQRETSAGPFYFDSAQTPDAIADLDHEDWVTSGGKQVGQMSTTEHGVQKLYVGWDATQLRLRWQGVNLSSDGDLYLYLGTGSSGSTALYNPYGASQSGVLPFAANYLVRLSDGITPTLLAYSGSWITQTEVAAVSAGDLNDLLLSFADLGISNPAGTILKVLGAASVKGTLDIWATLPDKNLGQTWNQFIQFGSLGSGIVPANGVWADAQLEVKVLASPAAGVVGAGDSVSLTVAVQNVGSAPLPQLTVNGSTSGGAALNNVPQTASNLPVSGTGELTMNGTINSNGQIMLTLADSYHRPYQLTTLDYTVDLTPPTNVTVASSYANPGSNTAYGFAQDESSINRFDLEVNGSLMPCTSFGFAYQCVWDAGNAAEGSSFSLRGKATDAHGNEAWSDIKSVQVDSTAPTLSLSAASQAALSDGRLSNAELGLTGTLSDTVAANSAQLCSDGSNCTLQSVLADGSWTLFAPALGDGVTTTLSIVGDDVAGNVSQPLTRTVIVDSVAPSFGPTTINQGVFISNVAVLLGYGTVTDGGGVAGVQLYIVRPDGSSTTVTATLTITSWTSSFLFDQVGVYQVVAVATDLAGNRATQVVGDVTAQYAVIPPQSNLLTVRVVGSGVVTPSLSSYITGTLVPITATANPGWSFANWSGAVVTTTNPTSIKMDADKVITATFTQNSYTVVTGTVGNGSVQIVPQRASYRYGEVVTLTADANTGSLFSGWIGDVVSVENPLTVTINSNKLITATFALTGTNSIDVKQPKTSWNAAPNSLYGTLGYYDLVFNFTNTSQPNRNWHGVYYQVITTTHALLMNPSDGTPGGVGETINVPDGALPGGDGLWQFAEILSDQLIQVGITDTKWKIKVAIYAVEGGAVEAAGQSGELLGTIELDESQVEAPSYTLFLPVIAK